MKKQETDLIRIFSWIGVQCNVCQEGMYLYKYLQKMYYDILITFQSTTPNRLYSVLYISYKYVELINF